MKNLTKILMFASLMILISLKGYGQTDPEKEAVLQKCLTLEALKQYMPLNSDGTLKQIFIVQYPVSFTIEQDILVDGSKIIFVIPSELKENRIETYIAFRGLKIEGNTASANLNLFYEYNYDSLQFKIKMISIELKKINGIWNITNSTIK